MDTSQVTKRETPVPEQLSVVEKVFFVSVLTLIFFPFPLLVVGGLWLKSRMPFTDFIRFKFMKGWKRVPYNPRHFSHTASRDWDPYTPGTSAWSIRQHEFKLHNR